MLCNTMTVLLDYIDRLLQMLNITINIYFALPYYVDIMLHAFNDPLYLRLCRHNIHRWVPAFTDYFTSTCM